MKTVWTVPVLMVMTACAPAPVEELPQDPIAGSGLETRAPDTCNAASFAGLLGQPRSAAATVPEPKRVVGPGDIVTNEYVANRINIGVNADGTITELGCG